jgi:hypothetical protein
MVAAARARMAVAAATGVARRRLVAREPERRGIVVIIGRGGPPLEFGFEPSAGKAGIGAEGR